MMMKAKLSISPQSSKNNELVNGDDGKTLNNFLKNHLILSVKQIKKHTEKERKTRRRVKNLKNIEVNKVKKIE